MKFYQDRGLFKYYRTTKNTPKFQKPDFGEKESKKGKFKGKGKKESAGETSLGGKNYKGKSKGENASSNDTPLGGNNDKGKGKKQSSHDSSAAGSNYKGRNGLYSIAECKR